MQVTVWYYKYISVSLYVSLRFLNITWTEIDEYLKDIGIMSRETSHKWATVFIKGNYEEFSNDLRGGEQAGSFYDTFPEIETDAKAFVGQACSQKLGEFKATVLAQFADEKYYELTGLKNQIGEDLIGSERSCRRDLRRWGAKFETNSQRPYFEGRERGDVVKHCNECISYFLALKNFYYTISNDKISMWEDPTQSPHKILICN